MEQTQTQTPTVLVVDDYDDIRLTLRLLLEGYGCRVIEAADGEEALQVARRERPRLILMDIGMPQRSGISATYKLGKDPDLRDVPVIAITAYNVEQMRLDALKAGCVECLLKPIDVPRLRELVTRYLPELSNP